MKSNKELLDFYGVEIGKKYIITKQNKHFACLWIGSTFVVTKDEFDMPNIVITNKLGIDYTRNIHTLGDFDYEEVEPAPLSDEEREYLKTVIKPFRDSVVTIEKLQFPEDKACIHIEYRRCDGAEDCTYMPMFNINDLYLGMKNNKKYTLEELGL
jgi:hypothetical protein